MNTIGYKFLTSDMKSKHGNVKWTLNKWIKHDGKIELCHSGLHASPTPLDSLEYALSSRWFQVEARGNIIRKGNKFVASEMRIVRELDVKKILPKFACIAARSCLSKYKKVHPNDMRPRKAIETAESYTKNPTSVNESTLDAVAWHAALSAASSDVLSAAYAAYAASYAAYTASSAASTVLSTAASVVYIASYAEHAASFAASAAYLARRTASDATRNAAKSVARKRLNAELVKMINKTGQQKM